MGTWAAPRLALWGLVLAVGCSSATVPESPASAPPPRPQSGESCDDPLPLPLGRLLVGSTLGAADTVTPKCSSGGAPDRVYRFRVEQRSLFRATLQGDFDAVLALRQRCGQEGGEIACNDDVRRGQSQRSLIEATLSPGDHYLVVDGSRGASGDYELFAFLDPIEAPASACAAASLLAFGETARGSTLGAPDRFQATCGHGAQAGERVYRLEVPAPSRLRVLQQTEYDGVLYLRSQCEMPTRELACNDDFRGPGRSMLTARVPAGTYFLFTDGLEKPQEGSYTLLAERGPLEPSSQSNEAVCQTARALPLHSGVTEVDTFREPARQAGSCGGAGAPESVYALEVDAPSRLRARLAQPEFNAVLYLRERCGEPTTELVCERQPRVDRGRPPVQRAARSLDLELSAGTHYLFVDGVGEDDFGAAHLEVELTPLPELKALCDEAPALTDGQVIEGRLSAARDRFGASCGAEARGPEHVYRLEVPRRSVLQLELDSAFDAVLHVRRECSRLDSEVACNDDAGHSRHSGLTALLEPGSYRVFVDGFGERELGPYRLGVTLSPAH